MTSALLTILVSYVLGVIPITLVTAAFTDLLPCRGVACVAATAGGLLWPITLPVVVIAAGVAWWPTLPQPSGEVSGSCYLAWAAPDNPLHQSESVLHDRCGCSPVLAAA